MVIERQVFSLILILFTQFLFILPNLALIHKHNQYLEKDA